MNEKDFNKKEFKEILDALIEDQNSAQLTAEEQETLEEVMRLLDGFDTNLKDLAEAKEEGMTRDQWVDYQLRKSVKRLNVTKAEEEKFIEDVDQAIGEELYVQVTEEKVQTSTNQETEEAKQ
ncbi:MAG: hypothetical protein IKW85_04880 [Muribaculaceae bacterium]|nr:hypothetical protein [Muribaculaceae bacterium]